MSSLQSSLSSSSSSSSSSFFGTSTQPSPTQPPPSSPPNGGPSTSTEANTNLGSSASLYLYTFLATLVLLLVVSAAIVVRSLMLRRRHRMMIDEAIRNGTLPPPFAHQRPRVDLSKKPKMWNAWIETAPEPPKTGGRSREKEWYWDMIKPFSVISALPPPLPHHSTGGNGSDDRQPQHRRPRTASILDRLRRVPLLPTNDSTSPSTPTQPTSASATLANLDSGNVSLKVAVLIAMPRKPPSSDKSSSTPRSPQSPLSRPVSALLSSRPLSAATITEQCNDQEDDEEQLPHLEIGVTEVRVVPNADETDNEMQEKREV